MALSDRYPHPNKSYAHIALFRDAVIENDVTLLKELIDDGIKITNRRGERFYEKNPKETFRRRFNEHFDTTFDYCVKHGYAEICKILIENGIKQKSESLHQAVTRFDVKMCNVLLDAGADLNKVDKYLGWTAFHCFCGNKLTSKFEKKEQEFLKFLLNSEADVNVVSKRGETPFDSVIGKMSFEVCKALIDAGAKDVSSSIYKFLKGEAEFMSEHPDLVAYIEDYAQKLKEYNFAKDALKVIGKHENAEIKLTSSPH